MSFIERFGGNKSTMAHSGLRALNEALKAGMTINQIRDTAAREGITFGYRAQEVLDRNPASSFIAQYGGNADTAANSGMRGVQRALQAGLTPAEIERRAGAEGVSFGVNAQTFLGAQRQIAESQARFQQMQQQFLAAQRQAEEAAKRQARQMQIAQAMNQQDPADVRFSRSRAERKKLSAGGTSGYFGRKGLRIKGVNVASQGGDSSGSGSFA